MLHLPFIVIVTAVVSAADPAVVLVEKPDEALVGWARHVEQRTAAWRGVSTTPPLRIELIDGALFVNGANVAGTPPPAGFLERAGVVEAFGLGAAADVRAALLGGEIGVEPGGEARRRIAVARAVVRALLERHHGERGATPRDVAGRADPLDDDAALARSALSAGEVEWIAGLVISGDAAAIAAAAGDAEDPVDLVVLPRSGPSIARAWRRFLTRDGEAFVRAVQASGGWEAVDRAFREPPASTEQVLHPRRGYLTTRDAPTSVTLAPILPRLGDGWRLEATTTLGEFGTGEFVRLAGDPVRAVRVARGWDGDRAAVFRRDEPAPGGGDPRGDDRLVHRVLQWEAVFDAPEDAAELVDALRKVFQRRYHHTVVGDGFVVTMDDEMTRSAVVDPNGRTRSCATRTAASVRWIDVGTAAPDAAALLGGE